MVKIKVYFLMTSITFLQFFIPIVIEAKKRGYDAVFLLRTHYKDYANILLPSNALMLKVYSQKFGFKIYNATADKLRKCKGIVFMVDGDLYGRNDSLKASQHNYLEKKRNVKVSLIENMNYKWVYPKYISYVDYVFFPNKTFTDEFKFNSPKNIYLGNSKYDGIGDPHFLFEKFKLNKKNKHCLILFPKHIFRRKYKKHEIIKIYEYLRKMNYKLIVKTRPKDSIADKAYKGDYYVCSDKFPNESLELMKICDLCVMFSSSASEETIYSKIPCIDLPIEHKIKRHSFFDDDKVFHKILNWKRILFDEFKKNLEGLVSKNSPYFDDIIKEKFFSHSNSSKRYFDFIEKSPKFTDLFRRGNSKTTTSNQKNDQDKNATKEGTKEKAKEETTKEETKKGAKKKIKEEVKGIENVYLSDGTISDDFDDNEVNITNDIEKYMKIPNDFRFEFMKEHPHVNFNTQEGKKRLKQAYFPIRDRLIKESIKNTSDTPSIIEMSKEEDNNDGGSGDDSGDNRTDEENSEDLEKSDPINEDIYVADEMDEHIATLRKKLSGIESDKNNEGRAEKLKRIIKKKIKLKLKLLKLDPKKHLKTQMGKKIKKQKKAKKKLDDHFEITL
jgi:hypothetical protein